MNIDRQIETIVDHLGGFKDRPHDQGGPIKFGINLKTLQNWQDKACTAEDLAVLDREVACKIYYSWYYIKPGFDALPPLIQSFMVDAAIDCGRHCAVRFLQDALICHGFDCGKQDGKVNDRTLKATRLAEERMGDGLLVALVTRRVIYYQNASKFDPGQAEKLAERIVHTETFLEAINRPPKPSPIHLQSRA